MQTFNLCSDLHLNHKDLVLPGGDVLILAGDIIEAGHLRRADNADKDTHIAARYRRFFKEELSKYNQVVYVCGNHEHYFNDYEDTHERIIAELPHHVTLLENSSIEINGVHVYGATLWTDVNKSNPITAHFLESNMNDYSVIKRAHGTKLVNSSGAEYYTSKFSATFTKALHYETVEKLNQFCKAHANDTVLLVTHHAPCELSISDTYRDDYHMNGGYHSRLGDFILDRPCIKAAVHGHIHSFNDYVIGGCRIMSNPRGYAGCETIANTFDPSFSFTL